MLEPAALLPDSGPESQPPALRVVREEPPPATGAEEPPSARPSAPPPARPSEQPFARLEVAPYDLASALALEREVGIGHVLAQALVRRGFTHASEAGAFLDAREEHPPSAFDEIDRAVALIH